LSAFTANGLEAADIDAADDRRPLVALATRRVNGARIQASVRPADPSHDRSALLHPAVRAVLGLSLSSRIERGYLVATLSGELDIAAAPRAREKLLAMLAPAPSRLAIDLSAVSYADATGLAVLVATDRRARLIGGLLRLAAPSPEVANVLSITGLSRHLEIFPTIHAAITSPPGSRCRHDSGPGRITGIGESSPTYDLPAFAHNGQADPPRADDGDLRTAAATLAGWMPRNW
jgi:anti-sigma B factor antagonist